MFAVRTDDAGISYQPGHTWIWRGFPGSQRYSPAPFYAHEERLEKLDLRVRQVLVEKALLILDDLKDSPEVDGETLGPLVEQSPVSVMVRAAPEPPESPSGLIQAHQQILAFSSDGAGRCSQALFLKISGIVFLNRNRAVAIVAIKKYVCELKDSHYRDGGFKCRDPPISAGSSGSSWPA